MLLIYIGCLHEPFLLFAIFIHKNQILQHIFMLHILNLTPKASTTIPCFLCCLLEHTPKRLDQCLHHSGLEHIYFPIELILKVSIQEMTSYRARRTEMAYTASHCHMR